MSVGQVYPAEWHTAADPQTGRPVRQLTGVGHNYHLYFYNPSVTPDGRYLVFYSERTGRANLFRLDLHSGLITQLTDAGPARADYWPFSPPVQGVGICLAALGDGGRRVYYFEGNALYSVHLETFEQRPLLTVPPDRRPSMLNANAAGDTLVFATWDEALFAERSRRAYAGEQFTDEQFFQATTSTILRVDTATGTAEEVLRMERFWINHVLINPVNRNRLLFCHEFSAAPDRMWLLDTASGACGVAPGQGADEWYQHEFWSADGARICFHGGWQADPNRAFAGWCRADGSGYERFAHTTPGRVYAHYNLHPGGRALVTDGEAAPGCISRVELVDGQQHFTVLCRHDSEEPVEDQRAHPHPQFTPDGAQVLFTANHGGLSQLYSVPWDAPPMPDAAGDHLPPLDFSHAAYTGWTRAHWVALLSRVTYGFARRVSSNGSPARVLYPDDYAGHTDAVNGLESFARLALVWGAWLNNPANPARLTFKGYDLNVAQLLTTGLLHGTDPRSPYYWGDIGHLDQRIVECSCLAIAIWLSREQVFNQLTAAQQTQVMAWLAQVDGKGTYPDNWVMFPAMSQSVRLRLGYPAPAADLRRELETMAAFYRGDGWYADGPGDEFDLYNAWMFGGHYLFWAWMDGDRFPDLRDEILERARTFLAGFQYFFGANGSYVGWGRSLGSRFGALIAFALGHALGVAPADPGLLRRISSGNLRYYSERGLFHPTEHYLTQGVHGPNHLGLESYVSPGSPHAALAGMLALMFDAADPFWTAPEAPLPVECGDFELVLPAPGFVVSGRQATGQVLLLNSRASAGTSQNYPAKYGKLVYSTHFPFNVVPVQGSYGPDALPALTADGLHFGQRVQTRRSGVAPGFIWSAFDALVDDEPQAMQTAVLLWRDVQVVLTAVQPTLPVAVYHAPAALGVERPAGLVRRSDPAAGWEYAEGEGRAVAIRRLLGYDAQQSSAPFLGRSTLNSAYPYAEHPLVYETQLSIAPRYLASLALARPAPFDPATELAGFSVTEADGVFTITCPDGTRALVGLGPRLPSSYPLGSVTFTGAALRYARALAEGCSYAGLGVDEVVGIVRFEAAATFAIERQPDGGFTLSTDTYPILDHGWLGAHRANIEGRTLAGAWEPVETLNAEFHRTWQRRTGQQIVTYRFTP